MSYSTTPLLQLTYNVSGSRPVTHLALVAREFRLLATMVIVMAAPSKKPGKDGTATPATKSSSKRRYRLAELLRGTDANATLNADTAWAREGGPVGREIG